MSMAPYVFRPLVSVCLLLSLTSCKRSQPKPAATEGGTGVVVQRVTGGTGKTVTPAKPKSGAMYVLPPDRRTVWKPGLMPQGGIPTRPKICARVHAAEYGNGARDATEGIQAAIRTCPLGETVLLDAGKFLINDDIVYINKGITLRGAGAGKTFLTRTNGAVDKSDKVRAAKPVVLIGAIRWLQNPKSTKLEADGKKGARTLSVESSAGLEPGMLVLLDELSGAKWMPDPQGHGRKVWASPDYRVVYTMHLPAIDGIDDSGGSDEKGPYDRDDGKIRRPPQAMGWFSRTDRPTAEIHEVASVKGQSITFTSPLHASFRRSHQAELTRYENETVTKAGLEGVTVTGGDDGGIRFVMAANSWAKNVEVKTWVGEGVGIGSSHAIELRDSYVHDAAHSAPGGGAYAVSLAGGSADCLLENNVILRANKVIVARSSGAGSVVAYNYMDQGFIDYSPRWQEMGVGGSHMVGPHHMLFEGNWSFNGDNDHTHGSSTYHTYFRNYLTGYRAPFTTNTGIKIDDEDSGTAPRRCAGASAFSYWMSFVGNVLGTPDKMDDWEYESFEASDKVWAIGWENHDDLLDADRTVAKTLLRDGNYDFLTGSVHWHGIGDAGSTPKPLPKSMYLSKKPKFFGNKPWPWVEPTTGTIHTLPAKARYDAGKPNQVK